MYDWFERRILPFPKRQGQPYPTAMWELECDDGGQLQLLVFGDGMGTKPAEAVLAYLSPEARELPDTLTPAERAGALQVAASAADEVRPNWPPARYPFLEEIMDAVNYCLPRGMVLRIPDLVSLGAQEAEQPMLGVGIIPLQQVGLVPELWQGNLIIPTPADPGVLQ